MIFYLEIQNRNILMNISPEITNLGIGMKMNYGN